MNKFKPIILTSIICAIVLALVTFFIPHMDWVFLPYLILAGCFIVWTQKENKSYKFLYKLLIGSLLLGFLAMFFIFLKMYLLSHSVYNAPLPFRELWDEDTIVLTLVYVFLCFLGGLLGIVLKGFYVLYKNKLDKIIIFAGPLLVILSSLSIIKIKVGGTIKGALHGWPYPFLIHQIKDIVHDFQIDKWIFSPGSLYHYIVFNYLLYLIIFFLTYCLIKLINKKLKIKKINAATFLFGLLILMIVAFISFLPVKKSYIDYQIARANYCEQDRDCVSPGTTCPFGCEVAVNRKESDRISSLIYSFPYTSCDDKSACNQLRRTVCWDGRCEAAIVHSPEAHWMIIVEAVESCQVKSIVQTHDLVVKAELKSGIIILAKEPAIDDIFDVVANYREKCGEIIMATDAPLSHPGYDYKIWNYYGNPHLGFSIQIPKEVANQVPVKVFEDNKNGIIYVSQEYYYKADEKITNSLESLRSKAEKSYANIPLLGWFGWAILIRDIKDEGELDKFIKENYGSGCFMESKDFWQQQSEVYEIKLNGFKDAKGNDTDLGNAVCPVNYIYKVLYIPEKNKVMSVKLGQECTFRPDPYSKAYKCYDEEMINSFKFE